MFSLIITIISIALVAALAVATLYYGGSAFSQGSAKAVADTIITQAQQIAGANTLYANDNGGSYSTIASLTAGSYLASAPTAPVSAATAAQPYGVAGGTTNYVTLNLDGPSAPTVCLAIAKAAGTVSSSTTVDSRSAVSSTTQFDCAGGAVPAAFQFKG